MNFQEQATEAIRASGGRMTSQRELLLDLLADTNTGIDAETLHQFASEQDPSISLPTVYRTLRTLEDAQVIASSYVSRDHDRKVYRVSGEQHSYHFTCRRCGRVTPFESDIINLLKDELAVQLGVKVQSMCLCASGLCADCQKEKQFMTLDQLQNGQPAEVRRINGTGAIRRRLMDMGLVKGSGIEMVKAAPMGDPVEYLIRGYHLSLRKAEAELVEIELC